MVHRTRLDKPQANSVAEHDHVSEVYHVISGSATLVTGPDLVDAQRRPATNENVRLLNGPGSNAASIRNGVTHQLKAGDAIIIPAGTGHWFTKIDDHISYIMIRIDPDKVVPLKDEAASKAYLAGK
jgi:mannose-6-phosphate isomerase-like protein (cupin superfamily)